MSAPSLEPLASITETARLIADGSYGVQIEKKFDDEVGELTDTINDMSLKIKQSEKTQSGSSPPSPMSCVPPDRHHRMGGDHSGRRAEGPPGRAEGNGHHRLRGAAADQHGGGAAGVLPH
ncbi:MAG: HAMP domain-containing protein [Oscillospiraceae bacterium]